MQKLVAGDGSNENKSREDLSRHGSAQAFKLSDKEKSSTGNLSPMFGAPIAPMKLLDSRQTSLPIGGSLPNSPPMSPPNINGNIGTTTKEPINRMNSNSSHQTFRTKRSGTSNPFGFGDAFRSKISSMKLKNPKMYIRYLQHQVNDMSAKLIEI